MSPFETKRKNLEKLVREFNSLDFNVTQIEFSDELSAKFDETKRIVEFWRSYYNYSSSDERYTNATMSQIYQDYLMINLYKFKDIFGEPIAQEDGYDKFMKELEKDCEAIKNCKENYLSPEEKKKILVDDKKFYEEKRLLRESEFEKLSDQDKERFENIKKRLMVQNWLKHNG